MPRKIGNAFAMDLRIVQQAGERWYSQESSRDKKIRAREHGNLEKAEPKERIGKRIEYLLGKVRQARGAGDVPRYLESMLAEGAIEEADSVTLERVIGETRDFLSIAFLAGGIAVARSVGRVVTELGGGRKSFGTGFLVAPGLLLTNWHVLETAGDAEQSSVEFNYQRDRFGQPMRVAIFSLRPDVFFLSEKELDFALVAVDGGEKLKPFGFCPLIGREGKILIGDPINIIQHPKGEMKQVVVRENRLLDLPKKQKKLMMDRFAHYEADTEPGSSGSPVFNDQWDVIALHHSGVPEMNDDGEMLDIDGHVWVRGRDDPARLSWIGNEGIRVSRLVAYIRDAPVKAHERGLRETFLKPVDAPEPDPPQPPEPPNIPESSESKAPSTPSQNGGAIEMVVPLTISVQIGTGGTARSDVSAAPSSDDEP